MKAGGARAWPSCVLNGAQPACATAAAFDSSSPSSRLLPWTDTDTMMLPSPLSVLQARERGRGVRRLRERGLETEVNGGAAPHLFTMLGGFLDAW